MAVKRARARTRPTVFAAILTLTGTVLLAAAPSAARAEALQDSHVLSTFGSHKYKADFKHFDYVNPNAPKGGRIRLSAIGTYDSLNPFIIKGASAGSIGLIYDSLFEGSHDEPLVAYGLIAETASYPADYSSVTYKLRQEARWHDGKPITVEDVMFSFETLKAAHPRYAYYYKNVVKAEKTGDREVTFSFDQTGNRELPDITAQLTILPKHYWQGTDANGRKRDILSTTLEPPLGSGPYRVKDIKPGKAITYERVEDYWAKDLPIAIGRHNFGEVQFDYYRDSIVALEAFKGDQFDIRFESSAKNWANAYKFPAVDKGHVIIAVLQTKNPQPMQAFVFNTRREKFADARVRLAFNHAFDFEWANKNLFFDQYVRVDSFFANSDLAAEGVPKGLELDMLEPLRGKIPEDVFTKAYSNPVAGDQRALRKNLRTAVNLLKQAGWIVKNRKLVNEKTGEQMKAEFLLVQPDFERIVLPYKRNLERLGISVSLRTVDASQYENRIEGFDFDIVIGSWAQSLSPGNEQRDYWGSASADRNGSRNLVGIKNPAVDALIDRIIFSKDREEQLAATHALDRVLLSNHYMVPQWYFKGQRVARWDRFGIPATRPQYSPGILDTWWYDAGKAAAVKGN
ncbi:MAG: extracellular solute-binding protein [Hyphomicrobiales bacterium]